jgi:hypothetical protein
MTLWDWRAGTKLLEQRTQPGAPPAVYGVVWSEFEPQRLATYGQNHIRWAAPGVQDRCHHTLRLSITGCVGHALCPSGAGCGEPCYALAHVRRVQQGMWPTCGQHQTRMPCVAAARSSQQCTCLRRFYELQEPGGSRRRGSGAGPRAAAALAAGGGSSSRSGELQVGLQLLLAHSNSDVFRCTHVMQARQCQCSSDLLLPGQAARMRWPAKSAEPDNRAHTEQYGNHIFTAA